MNCEAKWGASQCKEKATGVVAARGMVYELCSDCAKHALKQEKLNNN